MNCYICGGSAVGQCQSCWKFYCADHGDRLCTNCGEVRSDFTRTTPRVATADEPEDANGRPTWVTLRPVATHEKLVGVVAVGQTQESDGTEITILSLEMYTDGMRMNYRVRDRVEQTQVLTLALEMMDWAAADDLGTTYAAWSREGGGSNQEIRAVHAFAPVPPDGATRLELVLSKVTRRDPMGAMGRPIIQSGPWRFQIPLP